MAQIIVAFDSFLKRALLIFQIGTFSQYGLSFRSIDK